MYSPCWVTMQCDTLFCNHPTHPLKSDIVSIIGRMYEAVMFQQYITVNKNGIYNVDFLG